MPIYQAECIECGKIHEYTRSVAHYLDTPVCPCCGGESRKVIHTAPMGYVAGKFEPFRSQVDGSIIRTQKDLENHNKRNGVVNLGDGYNEEEIKNFQPPKQYEPTKEELAKEVAESIEMLNCGYKPQKIETTSAPTEGWSTAEVPE
jgi:putative FmdB family regulatory protein